jgi:Protein of unknown function (DUF2889)
MTSSTDQVTGRKPLHTRDIRVTGYQRDDGLFEVEGWLLDTKPFEFHPPSGDRTIPADSAIHHMGLRLIYDLDMTVREVIATGAALPYDECRKGPGTLQSLIGLNLARGWLTESRKRLAGAAGCVHFTSLLGPMAATAFQAMVAVRLEAAEKTGGFKPTLDSCIAYARDGDLVKTRYPAMYLSQAPDES